MSVSDWAVALGFASSWGIGKEGANINYCLDWQLALCPLAGVFMVMLSRKWDRGVTQGIAFFRPMASVLLGVSGFLLAVQAFQDCERGTRIDEGYSREDPRKPP